MNDSDNAGRVKGSIKDRLKSFLYRKRYRIKLMKNTLIKKETKIKFNNYKKFEIKDIRDLKKLGNKVIKVDLKNEKFDFDRYDYYIIEPVKKKGIDNNKEKIIQDKVKDIKNKTKEVKTIVIDTKKDLENKKETEKKLVKQKEELIKKHKEIEDEIKKIKGSKIDSEYIKQIKLNETLDIEKAIGIIDLYSRDIKEKEKLLNQRKAIVYNKIGKLKEQISSLGVDNINISKLENINLDSIENINNILDKIELYEKEIEKYENNLELVSNINTEEFINPIGVELEEQEIKIEKVEKLEENKTLEENKENIDTKVNIELQKSSENKIETKKLEVINKYDGKVIRKIQKKDKRINEYLNDINAVVNTMNKEVDKVTKKVSEVTKVEGYGKLIKSTLKLAVGLFTLPLTGINIFNLALGSTLINKGVKGIRSSIETKKEIKIDYDYEDLTNKIKNTKDKLELTSVMIKDSINQIEVLKQYDNLSDDNLKELNSLKDNLNKKLKEIDSINTKLNMQNEKNKIKIKKVNRKEY